MWRQAMDPVRSNGHVVRAGVSLAAAAVLALTGMGVMGAPARAAGTLALVADIDPSGDSYPLHLTPFAGAVVFTASDGTHGRELWLADRSGARMLRDIRLGHASSAPGELVVAGGVLYFTANDGTHGRELWRSDGTTEGTRLVRDIRPGTKGSGPATLTAFGSGVLFSAADGSHGRELWRSDGSRAGTRMVRDIHSGDSVDAVGPVMGGRVYFSARSGLWATDGTTGGTHQVRAWQSGGIVALLATANRLFLVRERGCDGCTGQGQQLWTSTGTKSGTHSLGSIESHGWPDRIVTLDGYAFYPQGFQNHRRLYRASGSAQVAVLPKVAVADDAGIVASASRLFLVHGGNLFVSDGTGAGTHSLDVAIGAFRTTPVVHLGALWYFPAGSVDGLALWQTDGTAAGSTVAGTVGGDADQVVDQLVRSGGSVWFTADDGTHGVELLRFTP